MVTGHGTVMGDGRRAWNSEERQEQDMKEWDEIGEEYEKVKRNESRAWNNGEIWEKGMKQYGEIGAGHGTVRGAYLLKKSTRLQMFSRLRYA